MIKVGKSVEETCEAINEEFNQKVDKETKIAGVSLEEDISASALAESLFKFSNTIAAPVYDKNGNRIDPTPEEISSVTNWAEAQPIVSPEEFARILSEPDPFGG